MGVAARDVMPTIKVIVCLIFILHAPSRLRLQPLLVCRVLRCFLRVVGHSLLRDREDWLVRVPAISLASTASAANARLNRNETLCLFYDTSARLPLDVSGTG